MSVGRCVLLLIAFGAVSRAHDVQSSNFADFIKGRLGTGTVHIYEGSGFTIGEDSHALDCSFTKTTQCCWFNVGGGADEFDWSLADITMSDTITEVDFDATYKPTSSYLATGSPETFEYYQALLVSCPIVCQSNVGDLTLSHWLTEGVKLDVCTMAMGSRSFIECTTLTGSRTSTVQIQPYNQPFHIVIVSSGFSRRVGDDVKAGGGLALVDDIVYQGADFCTGRKNA